MGWSDVLLFLEDGISLVLKYETRCIFTTLKYIAHSITSTPSTACELTKAQRFLYTCAQGLMFTLKWLRNDRI